MMLLQTMLELLAIVCIFLGLLFEEKIIRSMLLSRKNVSIVSAQQQSSPETSRAAG